MPVKYVLKLYVTGTTPRSQAAIKNLKKIMNVDFKGEYSLKVIDVVKQPRLAEDDKILATPTLIKTLPPPLARIIGDLSDRERVLLGLDLVSVG
jgi:circadian clock protein KaiB